jgi:hypothetical protein
MSAIIGCLLVLLALLGLTAQVAYCCGEKQGTKDERARADHRVRGALSRDKKKKTPADTRNTRKKKPKSSKTTIKVGEVEVPALVVKAKG